MQVHRFLPTRHLAAGILSELGRLPSHSVQAEDETTVQSRRHQGAQGRAGRADEAAAAAGVW